MIDIEIERVQVKDRKRPLGNISTLIQSIKELGLLNPITILPDDSLVAGYHRLEACKSLGWQTIPANVVDLNALNAELAEIDENLIRNELHWFDRDKQLARRKEIYENLYPETRHGVAGGIASGTSRRDEERTDEIVSFVQDTSTKVSQSPRTVELSIQRAQAFTDEEGEVLKRAEITQTDATKLARMEEPVKAAVLSTLASGKANTVQEALSETKREQTRERLTELRETGVVLPSGKYSCLVIDPPWSMQKIEREVRPNQVEFEYPTMSEDELKAFPLPNFAADDCHLYLWTTQKHLPLALRLAEHWGFRYQCLMTWVKNVGFTPFSWMYSTEHVLFCTRGSLPLLALGKRLDFSAKVREHSRKPDEFYNLVREVSPGPRLDIFSREEREGFEQYGNEVDKYVSAR